MWQEYAPEPRMRLNLGIRRRLAPLLDNDRRKIELAYSLLLTLPGSPVLYYGDEIGMGDNIWLPDRHGVRTPMQWDDSPGAGFSKASPDAFYLPLISDPQYKPAKVNVLQQRRDPGSLYHQVRRMLALRKEHSAFSRGEFSWVDCGQASIAAFLRQGAGERLLAVHNVSGEQVTFHLPLEYGNERRDLWTGEMAKGSELALPAHGYRWFLLPE